jgi:hypothetical protein
MQTFKISKKIIIGFILMSVGALMIISSFFINDPLECTASTLSTIFTSSFTVFGIGLLLLMIGLAVTDVEYHSQTKWIDKHHGSRKH